MSDSKWQCEVDTIVFPAADINLPDGKMVTGLTVGSKILLTCQGETGTLRSDFLKFEVDGKSDRRIKLLEVRKMAEHDSEFTITTYAPGDHRFKKLTMTDGLASYEIQGLVLQVNPVLNAQKKPEKAFGPTGPIEIPMPWYYFGSIAGAIFLVLALGGFKFYRRYQRRKLIDSLKEHNTALGAFNQLQKDLRIVQRQLSLEAEKNEQAYRSSIGEVEKIMKLFLVREFLIPANQWGVNLIQRELKRQYPSLHLKQGKELRSLLIELEKGSATSAKATQTDFDQLVDQTRAVADGLYRRLRA